MKPVVFAIKRLFAMVLTSALATLFASPSTAQQPVPIVPSGIDSLVVYNSESQPLKRITYLPSFEFCVAQSSDSFLLMSAARQVAQLHGALGQNTSGFIAGFQAVWVSRTNNGVLFVADSGPIVELDWTGKRLATINSRDIRTAEKLPSGSFIATSRGGELRLYEAGSETPRAIYGPPQAGRSVNFQAVAALSPSQLIAFDERSKELVWFDAELHEQSRIQVDLDKPVIFSALQGGSVLAFRGEKDHGLRFLSADQSVREFKTPLTPVCVGALSEGGFVIGYKGKGLVALAEAPFSEYEERRALLTFDSLFAIVLYATFGAWLIGRSWIFLINRFWRLPEARSVTLEPTIGASERLHGIEKPSPLSNFFVVVGVAAALTGLYGAWRWPPEFARSSVPFVSFRHMMMTSGHLLACWLLSGAGFLYLGRRFSLAGRLRPLASLTSEVLRRNQVHWMLIIASLVLAGLCNYYNSYDPKLLASSLYPKIIVASWIGAQVLIVMAVRRSGATPWYRACGPRELWPIVVLCVLTLFSRLLWIGDYPHNVHHDFGVIGRDVLRYLLDPWHPFFTLDGGQTVGRPWSMQMAGIFWLFGVHDWSLRLSSVVWSVGFVLAAYLIGRETVSHRFGLIFGALAAAQHNVLGYSRCPYVTESIAPFLFCLYYLCRGFRTRYGRDFAIAGVWAAWSVMTVRNFTPFPFIGAALFIFFCCAYPRRMWVSRWQVLLMVVSAGIVFSPYALFYLSEEHLSSNLAVTSPLFANYQFSRDPALWFNQFRRAFGGFLVYSDRVSWNMEELAPVCLAWTGALFGVGCVILLGRIRSVGAATVLITIVVDTILGSAFLEAPPSYYHVLVAITLAMYIVAIPLEYLWELASKLKVRLVSWALTGAIGALAVAAVVEEAWPFIKYSMPVARISGAPQPRYDTHSFMARYLLKHRERLFIAAPRPENPYEFHSATIALLYGDFSDRYELLSDLRHYLPVRPGLVPRDTTFFIDNVEDLRLVRSLYPNGLLESFTFSDGQRSIMAYTAPKDDIERGWREHRARADSPYLELFKLNAS